MPKQRRSRRTLTILVVLVLVSVTVITLDESGKLSGFTSGLRSAASDVFNPFRRGVDGVIDPIGRFFAGAVHYGAIEQQNANLRTELTALEHRKDQETYATKKVQALARADALKNLPSVLDLPSVVASQSAGASSDFTSTITIDEGSNEGIGTGDPVLGPGTGSSGGGLLGVVVQVNATTAVVQLMTTASFTVGVGYGTGQYTSLSGQGAGKPLVADAVPSGTTVTKTMPMDTTDLAGHAFPPGIPVAAVTSVTKDYGQADQTVRATPVADLSDITDVLVVLWGTGS